MSYSNPTTVNRSPVDFFYSFNMNTGDFFMKKRNKEGEDANAKENLKHKLKFVIIDSSLEQIRGWEKGTNNTISSNFGRNGKIPFIVKQSNPSKIIATGRWKEDIKPNCPGFAKFNRLFYIYDVERKQYGVLAFRGTALWAYSQHLQSCGVRYGDRRYFNITKSSKEGQEYYYPVFVSRMLDTNKEQEKALDTQMFEWDRDTLQPYLDTLFDDTIPRQQPQASEEVSMGSDDADDTSNTEENDDLPF